MFIHSNHASDAKPLATSTDHFTSSESIMIWKPPPLPPPRRRQRFLICCGCSTAILTVLAVTLVVLVITLYKARTPIITVSSITVEGIHGPNMTIVSRLSVRNRNNAASFQFDTSTKVFDRDRLVGVADGPRGAASAGGRSYVKVSVDVMLLDYGNAKGGRFGLRSEMEVAGRKKILWTFKHSVPPAVMNCKFTVSALDRSVSGRSCSQQRH